MDTAHAGVTVTWTWSDPVTPTGPATILTVYHVPGTAGQGQVTGEGLVTATDPGTGYDPGLHADAWAEAVAFQAGVPDVINPVVGWRSGAYVTGTLGDERVNYTATLSRISYSLDYAGILHSDVHWPQQPPGGPWDSDSALYDTPYTPIDDGVFVEYLDTEATLAPGGQIRLLFHVDALEANPPLYPGDSITVTFGATPIPAPLVVSSADVGGTVSATYTWSGVPLSSDGAGHLVATFNLNLPDRFTGDLLPVAATSGYQSTLFPFGGTGASLVFGGKQAQLFTRFHRLDVDVRLNLPAYRYAVPTSYPGIKWKFSDGMFRTVGATAAQPLKIRLPDGWHTWPGTTRPLYEKTATGWRRIG